MRLKDIGTSLKAWFESKGSLLALRKDFSASTVLLLVAYLFAQPPDIWNQGLFSGVIFGIVNISIFVFIVTRSYLLAVSFFYFCANTSFIWAFYHNYPMWAEVGTATSFGIFVTTVIPVLLFSKSMRYKVLNGIALVAVVSSVIMIYRRFFSLGTFSFMNNSAADASIMAVLIPIICFRRSLWVHIDPWLTGLCFVLPVTAILISGSSTGVVALGIMLAAWLVSSKKLKNVQGPHLIFLILVLSSLIALAIYFMGHKFLEDSGRFFTWKVSMEFWVAKANHIFGSAGGTYLTLGPAVQQAAYIKNGVTAFPQFFFMHNEYLQILFEQGAIGLTLIVAVAGTALYKARKLPWLFTSLSTYCFIALTQFPLRFFGSAFIGAVLLMEAFKHEEDR